MRFVNALTTLRGKSDKNSFDEATTLRLHGHPPQVDAVDRLTGIYEMEFRVAVPFCDNPTLLCDENSAAIYAAILGDLLGKRFEFFVIGIGEEKYSN